MVNAHKRSGDATGNRAMSIRHKLIPYARADERLLFTRALARSRNINPGSGLLSGSGGRVARARAATWARRRGRQRTSTDRSPSAVSGSPESHKIDQETGQYA